jgi:hypothetical protein
VVAFVEDLLNHHAVDDEDVVNAVEYLAREYNRQDGEQLEVEMILKPLLSTFLQMPRW